MGARPDARAGARAGAHTTAAGFTGGTAVAAVVVAKLEIGTIYLDNCSELNIKKSMLLNMDYVIEYAQTM